MPNAFHNSGYVVGAICTIIIGVICTYCIHMLLRSHYELCKRKKVIDNLHSLVIGFVAKVCICWLFVFSTNRSRVWHIQLLLNRLCLRAQVGDDGLHRILCKLLSFRLINSPSTTTNRTHCDMVIDVFFLLSFFFRFEVTSQMCFCWFINLVHVAFM